MMRDSKAGKLEKIDFYSHRGFPNQNLVNLLQVITTPRLKAMLHFLKGKKLALVINPLLPQTTTYINWCSLLPAVTLKLQSALNTKTFTAVSRTLII